jgi:hypothetical protein
MDRSGALKLTAIFIVLALGISTVGFGLELASGPNNTTAAATDQGNHDGSSDSNNTECTGISSTDTCLNEGPIVVAFHVKDTTTVKGSGGLEVPGDMPA